MYAYKTLFVLPENPMKKVLFDGHYEEIKI